MVDISNLPASLQRQYEALGRMRDLMEVMKKNQSLRGEENLKQRMAHRAATHKTWRQMKGMQLMIHEMKHPGNKPFFIGFVITNSIFLYMYFSGLKSEQAKAESTYWQRFHAKKEHH